MTTRTLNDLTVGIPTADDDPRILARALDAIVAEPLEQPVLIVDMSRGDGIREVASRFGDRVRLVPFPESSGVSDSRNRLIALAETRYLLMIDADAVPEPGWAAAIRAAFGRDGRAAVIGGRCLPVWPKQPPPLFTTAPAFDFLGMLDLGAEPRPVPRIMGTTYAIDRERLPGDPPFPVEIGRRPGSLLAFEEVAYCLGVESAGWTVWYEPSAVVHHHVRAGRDSWRWMLRRAFIAGRESRLTRERLEPLPRSMHARDRLFLAAIAPCFLAGKAVGPQDPRQELGSWRGAGIARNGG